MHVLHIIDSLGLGGAERMLVDIANATAADGHRVSVCVTRSGTALAGALDREIQVLVLGRRRRISVSSAARLAKWVREEQVDVLHVHMRSSLAFVLLLRVTRALRTPIVFQDHYGSIEADKSVPAWFRLGHPWVDHYVGVYDELRDWARGAGMPVGRTTTIANGLDLARLTNAQPVDVRAELGITASAPLGVLVASFKREKGIDTMIEGVARSRHRDKLRILVIGGGLDSAFAGECRALVRERGLGEVIRFVGARGDVAGVLPGASFALLSSHSESGPLVLVEYLAAGLPIVSTLVGDIGRRLAASGVPGFVPARDPEAFAHALDELLDLSRAQRDARGQLGREILATGWDIRDAMPRWYDVYRSVLRGSACVAGA